MNHRKYSFIGVMQGVILMLVAIGLLLGISHYLSRTSISSEDHEGEIVSASQVVTTESNSTQTVTAQPTSPTNSFEGRLIALTNQERVTPLKESHELDTRALTRAYEVCQLPFNESAHDSFYTGPGTSILSDLSNGSAENLARNFPDAASTHKGFMASPTHRSNIVNDLYEYVGIAHVICPKNEQGSQNVTVEFFISELIK